MLIASAICGTIVRPRHRLEAALLCFASVMLTQFPIVGLLEYLPVLESLEFEWERTALSLAAAGSLLTANALFTVRRKGGPTGAVRHGDCLTGIASFALCFLIVTATSYSSVVYRSAMLHLPELPTLRSDSFAGSVYPTLLLVPGNRVSPFELTALVTLVGVVLAAVLRRAPHRIAGVAAKAASMLVRWLVVAGFVVSVCAVNWPELIDPFYVTSHVSHWALVVGTLSIMLALHKREAATFWIASALGAMVAVRTTQHALHLMWGFSSVWQEFQIGVLIRSLPIALAVGTAASHELWVKAMFERLWSVCACLTLIGMLMSLDGFTWYPPIRHGGNLSQTTSCVDEVPGAAYHLPLPGLDPMLGHAIEAFNGALPPAGERVSKIRLYASLEEPSSAYLPVLLEASKHSFPLYLYAAYLTPVDLFTVRPFFVSNSSCALTAASLDRLRRETPPASVRSIRDMLSWLGAYSGPT